MDLTSYIKWCDISGEVVMTKIQWVQCLIQGYDVMREVDVTSSIVLFVVIEFMRYHLQCKGCQTYAECGDINTKCCDVILSGYFVKNIGVCYHRYTACNTFHVVVVMSSIGWV